MTSAQAQVRCDNDEPGFTPRVVQLLAEKEQKEAARLARNAGAARQGAWVE